MDRKAQIRQGLQSLAGKFGPLQTILGTVEGVNTDEMTCVIEDEDVTISDVRLRPVLNGEEGVTIFPKQGTWALIARLEDDDEWMLIAADQVEKYRIVCADCEFEIKDGFLIKRGDDTLKQVIQHIIEACQQIVVIYGNNPDYEKLATALQKLNNLMK